MKPVALSRVAESAKLDRLGTAGGTTARAALTGVNPLDAAMESFKVRINERYCGLFVDDAKIL